MTNRFVPLGARTDDATHAEIREVNGRRVVYFRLAGGKHHGAIGVRGGATVEAAVRMASECNLPLIAELDTAGAELGDHVAALHAWGRCARAVVDVSGRVPMLLSVTGACVSGPALVMGLFDVVAMTDDAFAYVTGPDSVAEFTGVEVSRAELGGPLVHATQSGVATFVAADAEEAADLLWWVLDYLPDHHLADPPRVACDDPVDRRCEQAATLVPVVPTASYDVRQVVADVVDADSLLELRARYAPNLVTALARLNGRPVGVVANQPQQRAGTLDIEASRKAARFVAWCDAFNLPLVTFVDTPGFEPGRDLEWRGMIRHGAELVHAYCAATVPRLNVILRKSYGGAYIVMDSRGIGNDLCVAWPTAEIAVMGAAPAVRILYKGDDPEKVAEYEERFMNPFVAAERGYVDGVIEPAATRHVLCDALEMLCTKRDRRVARNHSNSPL